MPRVKYKQGATKQQGSKLTTQRAWRATRRFTQMIPTLTKYARVVTRNPNVRVEMTTSDTRTDGKVIYIKPPIQLGDDIKHSVGACGVRDREHHLICRACEADDLVMGLLYHELAHIVFGSSVTPTRAGLRPIGTLVGEWHAPGACDHGMPIFEKVSQAGNYISALAAFDERLALMLNAMEDARVNARMFEARPGTRSMMDATMRDIFVNGVVQADGEVRTWSEAKIDMQVLMGVSLVAAEYYQHLDFMHEDARAVLSDPQLSMLIDETTKTPDIHALTELVVRQWRRLQELGMMVLPKCEPQPDEPDKPEDEPDQEDEPGLPGDESESGSGGDSNEEQDGDSGDDTGTGQPGDSTGSSGHGSPGAPGGNPGEDQDQGQSDPGDQEDPGEGGDSQQPEPRDEGDDPDQPQDGDGGVSDPEGHGDGEDGDEEDRDSGSGGGVDAEAPEGGGEGSDEDEASQEASGGEGDGERDDEDHGHTTDEAAGDEGDDESDDEVEQPADWTPSSLEEIREALNRVSIHRLLRGVTDEFAGGENLIHAGDFDPEHEHVSSGRADSENEVSGSVLGWQGSLEKALQQAAWFDGPSEFVNGVVFPKFPSTDDDLFDWKDGADYSKCFPDQDILGPITTEGRIAFSPNRRSSMERNLRSGKLNGKSFARQIPFGGDRIFQRKNVVKARSYHVIITLDVSGSTDAIDDNGEMVLGRMIRSVAAQAEALHRLGISFEVWAHSALDIMTWTEYYNKSRTGTENWNVWMFQIKPHDKPWDSAARQRLAGLKPCQGNLDGHTLQFLRKRADEVRNRFTDIAICYYTDGAMPAANSREEGQLLREETELCRRRKYSLIAVGAGTDSPAEWGFDTVVINTTSDLPKVMTQLRHQLGI